jgi:hypothetical protein
MVGPARSTRLLITPHLDPGISAVFHARETGIPGSSQPVHPSAAPEEISPDRAFLKPGSVSAPRLENARTGAGNPPLRPGYSIPSPPEFSAQDLAEQETDRGEMSPHNRTFHEGKRGVAGNPFPSDTEAKLVHA